MHARDYVPGKERLCPVSDKPKFFLQNLARAIDEGPFTTLDSFLRWGKDGHCHVHWGAMVDRWEFICKVLGHYRLCYGAKDASTAVTSFRHKLNSWGFRIVPVDYALGWSKLILDRTTYDPQHFVETTPNYAMPCTRYVRSKEGDKKAAMAARDAKAECEDMRLPSDVLLEAVRLLPDADAAMDHFLREICVVEPKYDEMPYVQQLAMHEGWTVEQALRAMASFEDMPEVHYKHGVVEIEE